MAWVGGQGRPHAATSPLTAAPRQRVLHNIANGSKTALGKALSEGPFLAAVPMTVHGAERSNDFGCPSAQSTAHPAGSSIPSTLFLPIPRPLVGRSSLGPGGGLL